MALQLKYLQMKLLKEHLFFFFLILLMWQERESAESQAGGVAERKQQAPSWGGTLMQGQDPKNRT